MCLLWRYMCHCRTAMYKFSCTITVLSKVHKRLILGLPAPRTISGCCAERQLESRPRMNHRVAVQPSGLEDSRDHTLSTEGYSYHCIYPSSDWEWSELAQAIPCSNLVRDRPLVFLLSSSRHCIVLSFATTASSYILAKSLSTRHTRMQIVTLSPSYDTCADVQRVPYSLLYHSNKCKNWLHHVATTYSYELT
jgi:hypothetical protein